MAVEIQSYFAKVHNIDEIKNELVSAHTSIFLYIGEIFENKQSCLNLVRRERERYTFVNGC